MKLRNTILVLMLSFVLGACGSSVDGASPGNGGSGGSNGGSGGSGGSGGGTGGSGGTLGSGGEGGTTDPGGGGGDGGTLGGDAGSGGDGEGGSGGDGAGGTGGGFEGEPGVFSCNPMEVDFGNVLVNQRATKSTFCWNRTDAQVELTLGAISGPQASAFTATAKGPVISLKQRVDPGKSLEIEFALQSTTAAPHAAELPLSVGAGELLGVIHLKATVVRAVIH